MAVGILLGACFCLSPPADAQSEPGEWFAEHTNSAIAADAVASGAFALSCAEPDAATLAAILPVATDHGSYASGVVFDNNRVLTAAHVINEASTVFVRVAKQLRYADVIMVDQVNDLAVLAVDTQAIEPIRIAGIHPVLADRVWAVGYPRAQAIRTSVGEFKTAIEGALHSSASIDSGQSGGGLLSCENGQWVLAGMLRGYGTYLQGEHYVRLENHSVSVAAATINHFLLTYY